MIPYVGMRLEARERGRVAVVTIQRPDKLNSLPREVMDQLIQAFRDLAGQEDLRCAVLTGAGEKAFIGGA